MMVLIFPALCECPFVLFDRYNKNDHVREDEMGRACGMNEGKDECI
jgi:hypothetical protein